MEVDNGLSPALDDAIQTALIRLMTNYGTVADQTGYKAQLANWRLSVQAHPWVTAELVARARDWFLFKDTDRERMPPFAVFLDACRRLRDADEARAAGALLGRAEVYALPDTAPDDAARPKPNVVHVEWNDGQASDVELTPPAPRVRSFEERQKKAREEDKVEVANVLECLCGAVVFEYPTTRKRTTPDGARHLCKWAIEALKERRK